MQCLRTRFSGAAGQHLLESYYRSVAAGRGAVGYVAEDEGQVLGYVCGVWAPGEVRAELLKTQWPHLMTWGMISLLMRPQLLAAFARRYRQGDAGEEETTEDGYELRPIVVSPAARGTGVAVQLVDRLLLDARSRGYDRMYLYTETDNQPTRAFYGKVGFHETGELQRDGASCIRYERILDALS